MERDTFRNIDVSERKKKEKKKKKEEERALRDTTFFDVRNSNESKSGHLKNN